MKLRKLKHAPLGGIFQCRETQSVAAVFNFGLWA